MLYLSTYFSLSIHFLIVSKGQSLPPPILISNPITTINSIINISIFSILSSYSSSFNFYTFFDPLIPLICHFLIFTISSYLPLISYLLLSFYIHILIPVLISIFSCTLINFFGPQPKTSTTTRLEIYHYLILRLEVS